LIARTIALSADNKLIKKALQMRPRERIVEILDLVNDIWQLDQDMRFLQLIYWLQSAYVSKSGCHGKIQEVESDGFTKTGYDLFHVEDDKFIEFLKQHLEETKSRKV